MNIYVGNLSYEVSDADLNRAFSEFGEVSSAKVVMDMTTGRSKGFGFIEMSSTESGENAISALNGTELCGRAMTVNVARPKESRPSNGGGYRDNRGGGNRGGRY